MIELYKADSQEYCDKSGHQELLTHYDKVKTVFNDLNDWVIDRDEWIKRETGV